MKVDLLIKNAKIFNSTYKRFYDGYLTVLDGRIYHATEGEAPVNLTADEVIDAGGQHLVPGLIDIHMHIESSMASPLPFGYHLSTCGVTTIVAEPHEIANVTGVEGIKAMLAAGEGADIDIYFGVPSSVPSTDATLETAGEEIGEAEVEALLKEPGALCLGEIMNGRAVIGEGDSKSKRLIKLVHEKAPNFPIEGHCPRLVGEDLIRFLYMGVDSDHTEHTLDEIKQRYFYGMCVQLQHKMMRREIIEYVAENDLCEGTVLVTDDVMADKLVRDGHLNHIVAKAIELGLTPEQAVYCATATPAARMRLYDRGRIRPGLKADFVILKDLNHFVADKTFKNGKLVYDAEVGYNPPAAKKAFPEHFYKTMKLNAPKAEDFAVPTQAEGAAKCRVIVVDPARTQTSEKIVEVPVKDGKLDWQSAGLKLTICFERHGKTDGGRGVALMDGSIINRGAIASSVAHDHHNLMVMGANPEDMEIAARWVINAGGGMVCVLDGEVIGGIELPVVGLLSERPLKEFAADTEGVTKAMGELGYRHMSPIMSFCTISLPVSPAFKLTDKGIVDVVNGRIVPLVVE